MAKSLSQAAKERMKDYTGPEREIGPDMAIGSKSYQEMNKDIAESNKEKDPTMRSHPSYGTTPASVEKRFAVIDKADNKAKAESKDIKPNFKKGGKVSSASSRADGCAQRGKTKGRVV